MSEMIEKKKVFPCDETVRNRALTLLDAGVTKGEMCRGAKINAAVLYAYLDDEGNTYTGVIENFEPLLSAWMDRRELQLLSGIPTIWTPVATQMESVAGMLSRCSIMGKAIGNAGIGKTRGCLALKEKDKSILLIQADGETGTRDGIRQKLFSEAGIRGPRKRSNRRLAMMGELYKRLRASRQMILVDQAHMLSCPAINLLVEVFNATAAPQMFVGTDRLSEKLDRDEQWASRLNFTWNLDVAADTAGVRELIAHQIAHRIPKIGSEKNRVIALCEKIAKVDGHFRRVEHRLNMMLFLADSPENKNKEWCDLFEQAAQFLPGILE